MSFSKERDELDFQRAVESRLVAGMAERRGWTREQYLDRCREVWVRCETDDDCPFKLLVDPLFPIPVDAAAYDYADARVTADLTSQATQDGAGEISCKAVGLMRLDGTFQPRGLADNKEDLLDKEPETPVAALLVVALFDVLGFRNRLQEIGIQALLAQYQQLIGVAIEREPMRCMGLMPISASECAPVGFSLRVRYAYFSDTILLWTPLLQGTVSPFLARCADLMCEALKIGMPLRGAITAGSAVMHKATSTYLGAPIVEATELEHAQEWVGVTLGSSTGRPFFWRNVDPLLVAHCIDLPLKAGTDHLSSGTVLDWPRRARDHHGMDAIGVLKSLMTSPRHEKYYRNAIKLVRASDRSANRELIERLAHEAIRARRTGGFTPAAQDLVTRAVRAGRPFDRAARFLEAVGNGQDPDVPSNVPKGLGSHLEEILLVAKGRGIDIEDLTRAILDARMKGSPIDQAQVERLAILRSGKPPLPALCTFLEAVAAVGSLPELPSELKGRYLKVAEHIRNAAVAREGSRTAPLWLPFHAPGLGAEPVFDLWTLLSEVVDSRQCGRTVGFDSRKTLDRMNSAGGADKLVAGFMEAIAGGGEIPAPPDGLPPMPLSFVRLVARLLGGGGALIDFGDLVTSVLDLRVRGRVIDGYTTAILRVLEQAGPPHDQVADWLRRLAVEVDPPPTPSGIPGEVQQTLEWVRRAALARPKGIDLRRLATAVIMARWNRTPLSAEHRGTVDAFAASDVRDHRFAAAFIEAVLNRSDLPEIDREVSDDLAGMLDYVQNAVLVADCAPLILVVRDRNLQPSAP